MVKIIVTPLSLSASTDFHISFLNSTSTPAVGSSKNKIEGLWDKAFAISTLLFIPPDNCLKILSFLSQRDNFFNTLSIYFGSGALPYSPLVKETLLNTVSKFSKVNS